MPHPKLRTRREVPNGGETNDERPMCWSCGSTGRVEPCGKVIREDLDGSCRGAHLREHINVRRIVHCSEARRVAVVDVDLRVVTEPRALEDCVVAHVRQPLLATDVIVGEIAN